MSGINPLGPEPRSFKKVPESTDRPKSPSETKVEDKASGVFRRPAHGGAGAAASGGGAGGAAAIGKIEKASFSKSATGDKDAEYHEAIRRIPEPMLALIQSHMPADAASKADLLSDKLGQFIWPLDPFFKGENLPYYALEALRLGKISRVQFATVMTFYRNLEGSTESEIVPLFLRSGEVNPRAVEVIRQKSDLFGYEDPLKFFEKMRRDLPPSESYLILTPDKSLVSPQEALHIEEVTVRHLLRNVLLDNILNLFEEESGVKSVIPSCGLMQAYLEARAEVREDPKPVLRMNFVIGPSTPSDIRYNARSHSRDVQIYFPHVGVPDKADNFRVEGTDFTYHDFYHSLVASSVPQEMQELFDKCYDYLGKIIAEGITSGKIPASDKRGAIYIKWSMIDMDHLLFFQMLSAGAGKERVRNWDDFLATLFQRARYRDEFINNLTLLFPKVPKEEIEGIAPPSCSIKTQCYLMEKLGEFLVKTPHQEDLEFVMKSYFEARGEWIEDKYRDNSYLHEALSEPSDDELSDDELVESKDVSEAKQASPDEPLAQAFLKGMRMGERR